MVIRLCDYGVMGGWDEKIKRLKDYVFRRDVACCGSKQGLADGIFEGDGEEFLGFGGELEG